MAATLNNLAVFTWECPLPFSGGREYEEALAIYRRLARKNPDVFEADMAMTLVNRAYLHGITQCYAQAQEEYAEALAIYRRLGQTTDMYNPQIENIEKSIDTIIAAGLTKKISLFRSHYGCSLFFCWLLSASFCGFYSKVGIGDSGFKIGWSERNGRIAFPATIGRMKIRPAKRQKIGGLCKSRRFHSVVTVNDTLRGCGAHGARRRCGPRRNGRPAR